MSDSHRLRRLRPVAALALTAVGALLAAVLVGATGAGAATGDDARLLMSPVCPADVAQGQHGACVAALQRLLDAAGAELTSAGNFGPYTAAAVRQFQTSHGLAVNGIAGLDTRAALTGLPSTAPDAIELASTSCPDVMHAGEHDGCVTQLQITLNGHGAALPVGGNFGPMTVAAVQTFQRQHSMSVSGTVGRATKNVLLGAQAWAPLPIDLSSSRCPASVTYGEHDGCVTELQLLLNAAAAGLPVVGGHFGPQTLTAVKAFQHARSWPTSGVAGPKTKAALMATAPSPVPVSGTVLARVVAFARAVQSGAAEPGWRGGRIQYVWAGGHGSTPGPSTGTCAGDSGGPSCGDPAAVGLDCSGFARWVYALAYGSDVLGPGGTSTQIREMRQVSAPVPGDLVFFGAGPSATQHVGIYIGAGQMINAYDNNTLIQTNAVTSSGHLIGYYSYGDANAGGYLVAGAATNTNVGWAAMVLQDAGFPQTQENLTVMTQWMASEEPSQNWFNRNNPLNNGRGSGGGSGLGSYPDLATAARYAAQNITDNPLYAKVLADMRASAPVAVTTRDIWASPWASSHYDFGRIWHSGSVPTVAAPASAW